MDKKDSILASCTRFLGAAVVLVCGYVTGRFTIDYKIHSQTVADLDISDPIALFKEHVEPLWHVCARAVQLLLRCSPRAAGSLVSGAALFIAYLIAWRAIRNSVKGVSALKLTALCLVLHLVAAIYIPWFNNHPYLGQGSPNVWHNPTLIMVRPICLLAFLLTARQLQKIVDSGYEKNLSFLTGLVVAILLVAANLAKPCYAQVFYPAIFLLMLGWLITSKGKTWKHCVQFFLMCLPSVVLMIFQFVFTFINGSGEGEGAGGSGGIVFAPLVVAKKYSPNILVSILLVLAFPLFMTFVTIVRRRFGQREILAWLLVLVGLAQKLLLAETGPRMYDGNFGWGYLNALIIIWFVSIRDYAEAFLVDRERPVETMTATAQATGAAATTGAAAAAESAAGNIAAAVAAAGNITTPPAASADGAGEESPAEKEPVEVTEGPAAVWTPEGPAPSSAETDAELPHAPEMADLTFSAENYTETYGGDVPLRIAPDETKAETERTNAAEETAVTELAVTETAPARLPEVQTEVPEIPEVPQVTEPGTTAVPAITEQEAASAEKPEASEKGGIKNFFVNLVRGVGCTLASIILAAHFLSGLYYLCYWLIWLRNSI